MLGQQIQTQELRNRPVIVCGACGKPTNLKHAWEFPREYQYQVGAAFDYEPNFGALLTECCGSIDWRRQ